MIFEKRLQSIKFCATVCRTNQMHQWLYEVPPEQYCHRLMHRIWVCWILHLVLPPLVFQSHILLKQDYRTIKIIWNKNILCWLYVRTLSKCIISFCGKLITLLGFHTYYIISKTKDTYQISFLFLGKKNKWKKRQLN